MSSSYHIDHSEISQTRGHFVKLKPSVKKGVEENVRKNTIYLESSHELFKKKLSQKTETQEHIRSSKVIKCFDCRKVNRKVQEEPQAEVAANP